MSVKPSSSIRTANSTLAPVSVAFLLTTLLIVATPGTGALITIAAGLAHGRRQSLIAAFGCTLGIVPHMLAAVSGLAALLHTSALAFSALKWAGVGYLFYLAWSTWRETGDLTANTDEAPGSARRTITAAILANLLNPKLTIFFFAFLPQFVTAGQPHQVARMLGLSGIFMVTTLVVFAAYGVFAAAVREHVISRPRALAWLRRAFAVSFVALGAKLAFARA
jgi:threonine/homoserine/homoserine lactone efflux protein